MKQYDPKKIEPKWQKYWQNKKTFVTKDFSKKPKKFVLFEFPYPSGVGLHVGHMRPYVATDVVARYFRLKGNEILYPMGWDAFGLPAENFAIKNHVHPNVSTAANIKNAKRQMNMMGLSLDWSREINTTDPSYYKWTQKLFLEFYKAGLAYEKFGEINWCPKDMTGLANEEVVDGKCDRCGSVVEKKSLRQWYLKITDYAEKLLEGLKNLPEWPEAVKTQQANWIGKSEGAEIDFKITGSDKLITVFTTRADTLFGVTYVVLAPEHELVQELRPQISNWSEVEKYIEEVKGKTDIERGAENKEKTGVELKGIEAINPANSERVPVWIADYALVNYGTGAVMAVPAHDERDKQFAEKFNLPIVDRPFIPIDEAISKFGKKITKYKLRDWVFSRQRYWGEPIPLIHCSKCGIVPVPDKDLPVKLPNVKKYEPTGTGESPLAAVEKWVNTKCPKCEVEKNKTKYLIFDFDGVIGDTIEACLKTYVDLGIANDADGAKQQLINWFTKHPKHHHRLNEISDEERNKIFNERHLPFGKNLIKYELDLFHDFIDEILKIKRVKVAIVSAGSEVYIKPTLKKGKLKPELIYCAEDSFSKIEKIEWICKKWKIDVKDSYYFTDTSADVLELENHLDRNKIIGCSWGYLGYEELRKTLPENQILKTPKNIHKLFEPGTAKRETNTMPQWAGSSWYWMRYMDPKNKKEFASMKAQEYWSPVDLYFGGMEHTTLHLLYSRFWNLFLYDRGLVAVKEPYRKRVPHGIILGPDGEKMSKSRGNVVNPDELVKIYGADTVRLYMMFLGPHGAQVAWNDKGIVGARRFIERVWAMQEFITKAEPKDVTVSLHKTIKKVTEDIESFSFNTAVSAMMIFANTVYENKSITKDSFKYLLILLSPFIPHASEEIWTGLKSKGSIYGASWPTCDESLLRSEKVVIVVQINGKVKAEIEAEQDAPNESVEKLALGAAKIKDLVQGREVRKVIVVKNRLVNIVLS